MISGRIVWIGTSSSFSSLLQLNNIYGHISVVGHGSGQALVQLDYSYGVDLAHQLDFPPVNSFEFNVYSQFYGRNNSHLRFTACQR